VKKTAIAVLMLIALPAVAAENAPLFLPDNSASPSISLAEPLLGYYENPTPFAYEQAVPLGIYFGGMYQPVVLPLDDASFLDNGEGWTMVIGFSPDVMYDPEGIIALEMLFGMSEHRDTTTGNEVDYTRLSLGFRWWDNSRPEIMPYLTVGMSFHSLDNNPGGTEMDGWGFYGGGGLDVFPSPYISIGIDLKVHVWAGNDAFGMVFYGLTPEVGVEVLFHF
jgi:hypothetical protein